MSRHHRSGLARSPGPLWRRSARVWVLCALAVVVWALPLREASAVSGIRDAEIEAMLSDFSNPLFAVAGLEPQAVDIFILRDQSINAFVTRGQRMYVHTGLITAAETPGELKGVIAHETGHIAGGHLARTQDAVRQATRPVIITFGLGLLAAVAGAPDVGAAVMLGSQHVAQRSLLAYSRAQESAADQAALTYLEATGQSAQGLYTFMQNFRDMEILSARAQDPYVRSHPLSSDRMAALENRIQSSPYRDRVDSAADQQRLDRAKAKLYGFLDEPNVTLRRFPNSDQSTEARYARAVAYFRQPNITMALTEIDALIAEEPTNAFFHELKGQILFESGDPALSVPHHRRASELAPTMELLRLNLATALIAQPAAESLADPNREAIEHLERVLQTEPDNAFAWRQTAIAYSRLGLQGEAQLATAERYFAIGRFVEAAQFSARARDQLPEGSPSWNRASDILNIAKRYAARIRAAN
ncbi:MAG: M48 family metalloprotease [Pseudomonadota bacterium]